MIRLYLLNQATQEYSSWLEEQILADAAIFQELLIAEDELIDQYLSDELTPSERQSFETHFMAAPERHQKLRFSRALRKYVDCAGASEAARTEVAETVAVREPARPRPTAKKKFFSFLPFTNPALSQAFAAVMLLAVVGLSWLAYKNWPPQTPRQPGNVYFATLTPGLTRDGGELKRISIPQDTGTLQLKLLLRSDDDPAYRAELLTSARASVWVIDDLKPQTLNKEVFVNVSIPTNILKRDDYEVRLSSRHSDGAYQVIDRYQFRVAE